MPYIDTEHLFKCETCRFYRNGKCNTFCDAGESYSPNLAKIPAADVVPRDEVTKIFEEIERNIFILETPYRLHCISSGFIEELKEKYTKGGKGDE